MPEPSKVFPGDPLRIPAGTWNALLDLLARLPRSGGARGSDFLPDDISAQTVVYVQNSTGVALALGDVIRLADAVTAVSATAPAFNVQPVFDGLDVDGSTDTIAIALEPIADGSIGRAIVQGVAIATVSISDIAHRYASPGAGVAYLTSGATGAVRLLSVPAGTGSQTVAVLLSNAGTTDPGEGFIGVAARFVVTNPYTVTFSGPTDDQWVPVGDTADGTSLTFDTGDLYNSNQIWIPSDGYYLFNMEATLITSATVPTGYAQDLILYEYAPTAFGDALLTASIPEGTDTQSVNLSVVRYMAAGKKFQLYAPSVDPMSFPYDLEIHNLRVSCVKLDAVGAGSWGSGGTTSGDGIGSYAGLARFGSY